jgi:hypothetical protein
MSFYMKLAKLLLGKKYGKALDKYVELKKNPEFNVLMGNLEKSQQELEDTVKDYCKRWPDSPLCKKHK